MKLVINGVHDEVCDVRMAARIGISSDGIKYQLEKMKSARIMRHVGPTKAGYWEILK